MTHNFVRYAAAAIIALSLPLGGCMETIGHPAYNHGPTDTQIGLCHLSGGPEAGYKCRPKPALEQNRGWGLGWW
jgi:hypothetical protein